MDWFPEQGAEARWIETGKEQRLEQLEVIKTAISPESAAEMLPDQFRAK